MGFAVSVGIACLVFYLLPQRTFEGQDLGGQWYSVLPPVVAVAGALFFRNLVVALTAAFPVSYTHLTLPTTRLV